MLMVSDVKKEKLKVISQNDQKLKGIDKLNIVRSEIPAVTHVDNSARIQTVSKKTNRLYYQLIEEFYKITSVPVLINTSFNIRGEPIVCSIEDAYRCFLTTELDYLICGNQILNRDKTIFIIMSFFIEFVKFLMVRKKYWLLPIIIILFLFGSLIILTEGTAVAPFIYQIF